LLGPGPRLIKKKNLPGRGSTKVEKTALDDRSVLKFRPY